MALDILRYEKRKFVLDFDIELMDNSFEISLSRATSPYSFR